MRRFLGLFALGVLMATSAMPVAAADPSAFTQSADRTITRTSVINGSKSPSGRLAQSDASLIARTDSQLVGVMVKVDVDAVASYKGGVNGLQATSPDATGKSLKENAAAVAAYQRFVADKVRTVSRAAQLAVPALQVHGTYTVAYGGFAARIPANQAKNLLKVKGVSAVQPDSAQHITANDSPNFVGASALWPSLGGESHAGQGVKVGVLDTGIWPEHDMFLDPGIPNPGGGPYGCEFGLSGQAGDAAFVCNDKMLGAYAFLDTNLLFTGPGAAGEFCPTPATCSARDADGHGTHTTSTAAGSPVDHAVLLGVDRGHISGIAPGASVLMYRVCDEDGCFSSDSVNAVQQAITDDVDVINFSISGGADAYADAVELAFLDAYAAGILVNASAGNSGPGAATANHAGPWVNTVGASTLDRSFLSTLHLTADGGATLDMSGVTVTAGIASPTPVVLASAAPYSDALCNHAAPAGSFSGMVVVCKRGTNGRINKGYQVSQGNAAGMILYNQSAAVTDQESDNHFLPAIHVQYNSDAVATFVAGHTNVMATWAPGTAQPAQGDVMASFSSRGPLGDFIKPDVTAPGVQILAGHTPMSISLDTGPTGEYYQAIAGTSMSSPHAAGVAALLKAAHPGWTPGEIKSAMMTQASTGVVKEDGVTPADPFDMGGGSIRANKASKAVVTFNVSSSDYYGSANNQAGRINLNLPSVNAPNMPGMITTWRTARNNSAVTQTYDITATGPAGGKITINPKKLTIAAWQTKSFFITIDGTKLPDGQYFGKITLNPRSAGSLNAVLPVAFDKHPGEVTLNNSCAAGTVAVGAAIACEVTVQNLAAQPANVSLRVKGPKSRNLLLRNWDAGNKKGNGFVWNGQLSESIAPSIISLTPGHGPGGGYLSLTLFGVPGEGFYTDETLANYSVPTFSYGHELYDTIAVTSDGYIVVGGGGSDDLNYIPQDFPNVAPPNNVLAPYWTDLNPSTAGDIYIATLTDGTDTWIVVEWKGTPVYPGPANPRSFQIWLQIGGTADEGIWFEHDTDAVGAAGSGDGLIVGADNRDGSSGADLGLNTPPLGTGYEVIAGSPTPGGSMTINYEAYGQRTGTYKILSTMTSDITQGTATDLDLITVTP
jgi:subtilisin family serine protease